MPVRGQTGIWINKGGDAGQFNVKAYGATGDGTTDDTTAIQAAFDAANTAGGGTVYFPSGTYCISTTVTCSSLTNIIMDNAQIYYTTNDNKTALQIGSDSTVAGYKFYRGLDVKRSVPSDWSSEDSIGIQIINAIRCKFDINYIDNFTIGVQCIGTSPYYFAWNYLVLGTFVDNQTGLDLVAAHGVSNGWTNENLFVHGTFINNTSTNTSSGRYGIRLRQTNGTTNLLNNNHFIKPSFELKKPAGLDSIAIYLSGARFNKFDGCRVETTATIFKESGNNTYSNIFDCGMTDTTTRDQSEATYSASMLHVRTYPKFTEHGTILFNSGNIAHKAVAYNGDSIQIEGLQGFYLSNQTDHQYIGSNTYPFTLYPEYINFSDYWGIGCKLNTTNVKELIVRPELIDSTEVRVVVRCYDANGTLITTAGSVNGFITGDMTYMSAWSGWRSADITSFQHIWLSDDVKSIALMLTYNGVSPATPTKLKGFTITAAPGQCVVPHTPIVYAEKLQSGNYASESPAYGFYQAGQLIKNIAPTGENTPGWVCISRVDTTLSAEEAAGQTVLSVTDSTGMSVGDKVGIVLTAGTIDWTYITVVAAGAITVNTALTGVAASGNAVYTFRFLPSGPVHGTIAIDPGSIGSVTRGAITWTLTGAAVGDRLVMEPPAALNDDLIYAGCRVTADNQATVYIYNPTGGTIEYASQTWNYTWYDLT